MAATGLLGASQRLHRAGRPVRKTDAETLSPSTADRVPTGG
jgi:hypothetical protein